MSEHKRLQGIRLLSLDGGGIRGLSELLILEEIMKRIKKRLGLKEVPLPCDYFDMIGGTSTGGLIALMLGRLGMSVGDAIKWYGILAQDVFRDVKPIGGDGRFKASNLKTAIQRIVKTATEDTEELMMNPEFGSKHCRTFVCAMPALNLGAGIPHLFRSYEAPKHETANCTIWEAARATSAAPTFFKRITIGSSGTGIPYIDGGIGCNNPTAQMLKEAEIIFPNQEVCCIVSIGTGQANTIGIPNPNQFQRLLPTDVVTALQGIATDCERTAQTVAWDFQKRPNIYFRFNVEQGLQGLGLADWEKLDEVATHTAQYMRMVEADQKLAAAAQALAVPKAVVIPKPEPSMPPVQFRPIYRTGFDVDPRDCRSPTRIKQLYYDFLPEEPSIHWRSSVGNGALTLEFNGLDFLQWRSWLSIKETGPVRVEATIDLSRCNAIRTPTGAGVLVILPDNSPGCNVCDLFFIVEPCDVPRLHVLKLARPSDVAFVGLHYETLPHCTGQQNVQVEVTVLDGMITVSTNGVVSTWALRMPTSGGPKNLRAFGLCGIGPRRFTWTSFQILVGDGWQPFLYTGPPTKPQEEPLDEDPELAMAIMMSMSEVNSPLEAEKQMGATLSENGLPPPNPAELRTMPSLPTTPAESTGKKTPEYEADEEADEAALLAKAIEMSLRYN